MSDDGDWVESQENPDVRVGQQVQVLWEQSDDETEWFEATVVEKRNGRSKYTWKVEYDHDLFQEWLGFEDGQAVSANFAPRKSRWHRTCFDGSRPAKKAAVQAPPKAYLPGVGPPPGLPAGEAAGAAASGGGGVVPSRGGVHLAMVPPGGGGGVPAGVFSATTSMLPGTNGSGVAGQLEAKHLMDRDQSAVNSALFSVDQLLSSNFLDSLSAPGPAPAAPEAAAQLPNPGGGGGGAAGAGGGAGAKRGKAQGAAQPSSKRRKEAAAVEARAEAEGSGDDGDGDDEEDEEDEEELFEVEAILDCKKVKSRTMYLVKWKGYDESENTWEPAANVAQCRDLVRDFKAKHKPE